MAEKWSNLRAHLRDPLFRNAYALLANTLGTSIFGLAYWILAARYYSPAVVGASSALIAALLLLSTVAQLNLGSALTRFLPKSGNAGRRLISGTYGATAVLAVLIALASGPWIAKLAAAIDLKATGPQLWMVVSVVVWALFALQDHVLTGLRRAVWVPAENALFGILKIALLVVLASAAPRLGIFASWMVPMALLVIPVNLLVFGRFLPRKMAPREEPANLGVRQIGHFVAFDYLGSLFSLASTHLLPVLIASRIGAEANAYFYMAWVVVATLEFALVSVTSSLTVEGAHDERRLPELTRALSKRLAAGGVVVLGVILAGAPLLLSVFGKEYAAQASTLLRLLVLGLLPRGVIILWMAAARVRKEVKPILAAQGTVSLIVLGLSTLLLETVGTMGAGIAYVAGQSVVALATLPRLRRIMAESPDADESESLPARVAGLEPVLRDKGDLVDVSAVGGGASMTELSVVVPVRNAERWIEECLESVAACNPAEVIVVDGLSVDSTVEIAEKFGARVLSDEGHGLPVARALGAAAARTRWVALIDADVVLARDSLQDLLDEFLEGGYTGLQAGLRSVSGNGYWGRALVNHHRHGWSKNWFGLAATIFDRAELLKHGFDEEFLTGEDMELRRRLKDFGEPVGVSRQTIVTHRFHDTFVFAKHQWISDGRGFARVIHKRGLDAWWLIGLPFASAAWGICTSLLRVQPAWIPYYFCFVAFNYSAMIKQLLIGTRRMGTASGRNQRATEMLYTFGGRTDGKSGLSNSGVRKARSSRDGELAPQVIPPG